MMFAYVLFLEVMVALRLKPATLGAGLGRGATTVHCGVNSDENSG